MTVVDERFEVRNDDIERALRTLATLIDGETPDGWGWGLFLVPFGAHEAAKPGPSPTGHGAVFWISNSERAGMVDVVKGWIADQEKRKGRTNG